MPASGWTRSTLHLPGRRLVPTCSPRLRQQPSQKRERIRMTNGRIKMSLYFALPVLVLAACVVGPSVAHGQMTSTGIDCSQIASAHLLVQDNQRAGKALMECGVIPTPVAAGSGDAVEGDEPTPPNVLVSNRSCSSGSTCTKSENMVFHSSKAGDNTIVVNYNDHNGNNYSGTSYSTDNGSTFTEISPPPFSSGHGTNYGDPIVVYNQKLARSEEHTSE